MNSETMDKLNDAIENDQPIILIGPPGVGKTERLNQVAASRNAYMEVLIASSREPSEIAGMPRQTENGVEFVRPSWVNRLWSAHAKGLLTILFLDEISCCHPALQAPLLRLIRERRMDDWSLPPGCRVIAAANPPELAAGGWDLAAATANRVGHVQVVADLDAWAEWSVNQPDPHGIRTEVVAFLKTRPALFCAVPKDAIAQSGPWPSPRSWDNACKVRTDGLRADLVGMAAYAEFVQWKRTADLPSPEDVCNGKAALPTRSDARFATLLAVAALAGRDYKTYGKAAWGVLVKTAETALDEVIVPAKALAQKAPGVPPELGKLGPHIARITK